METKKLSLKLDKKLIKEFKILSIKLDITMTKLLERAMENLITSVKEGHRKKKHNGFTKFGQFSIESIPTKKITRPPTEDTKTVDAVLPLKNLTEV